MINWKRRPKCDYIALKSGDLVLQITIVKEKKKRSQISALITEEKHADKWYWCNYDDFWCNRVCFTVDSAVIPDFDFITYYRKVEDYLLLSESLKRLKQDICCDWQVTETNSFVKNGNEGAGVAVTMTSEGFALGWKKKKKFKQYSREAINAELKKKFEKDNNRKPAKGFMLKMSDIVTGIGTAILTAQIREGGIDMDKLKGDSTLDNIVEKPIGAGYHICTKCKGYCYCQTTVCSCPHW